MELNYEIRDAIAEDHDLVREGIKNLIQKNKRLKVIISAENGQVLLDETETKSVDIVILDIDMPVTNGKDALKNIMQNHPNARTIILGMYFKNIYSRNLRY